MNYCGLRIEKQKDKTQNVTHQTVKLMKDIELRNIIARFMGNGIGFIRK